MAAAAAAGAVSQNMGQSSGAPPPGAQQVSNASIILSLPALES